MCPPPVQCIRTAPGRTASAPWPLPVPRPVVPLPACRRSCCRAMGIRAITSPKSKPHPGSDTPSKLTCKIDCRYVFYIYIYVLFIGTKSMLVCLRVYFYHDLVCTWSYVVPTGSAGHIFVATWTRGDSGQCRCVFFGLQMQ